jgi:hypothetical protein
VELARRAGDESEFSFTHAFKHAFGVRRAYNEPGATRVMAADFLVRRR